MKPQTIIKRFTVGGEDYVLRYPKPGDVDECMHFINSLIDERTFLGTQRKVTRKEEVQWLKNHLERIRKRAMVHLMVEHDGHIVGSADLAKGTMQALEHVGFLGIALLPEARGKGIGMRLLRATVAEAKRLLGIKVLRIDAMGHNPRAIGLYKKFGCKEIGRFKKGYSHFGKYVDQVMLVKYV